MLSNLGETQGNFSILFNQTLYTSHFHPVWISIALISIICFTVGGNSLVCIAVLRERNLQNTANYFLTSLAFTDCLVACLVMPIAATTDLIGYFPFDAFTCVVWSTFDVCCCTSSIWHMSVMSLDRYLTLRYPLKYGRHKRLSLMAYKIIIIWMISFAICLPLFILGVLNSSNVFNEEHRACFPSNRNFKIYGSIVAFFIPLIIMVVTYALTMSALQQAHSTKMEHSRRTEKIRAVVNLAAMAIRWGRAVSAVEISDQNLSSKNKDPIQLKTETEQITNKDTSDNERTLNTSVSIQLQKHREKSFQTSSKNSIDQPSKSHLNPSSFHHQHSHHTKRSNSCTPLVNMDRNMVNSSARTLLQIRRHSAKISQELTNLAAQLSMPKAHSNFSTPRPSLSVPKPSEFLDSFPPTFDQLIERQTRRLRRTFATMNFNENHPITERNSGTECLSNSTSRIPNLCVTHDSLENVEKDHQCSPSIYGTSCISTNEKRCQLIRNWIDVKRSSIHSASALQFTEHTPILSVYRQNFPTGNNLKKHYPQLEDLVGQTTEAANIGPSPMQQIFLNDRQTKSIVLPRLSISSITFSLSRNRRRRRSDHFSLSSSFGSSIQNNRCKPLNKTHDCLSQTSFQMVSLDTDDSSSCSSSLTHRSNRRQSVPKIETAPVRRKKFKSLSKNSTNNERKAMRVLLIIFSIFVILWTPFFVINLLSCFLTDIHPILISIATWFGYCSSCANPIIYTIFSRSFRRAFINILTCQKVIRSHRFHPRCQSTVASAKCKVASLNKDAMAQS